MNELQLLHFPSKVYLKNDGVKNIAEELKNSRSRRITIFVDKIVMQNKGYKILIEICNDLSIEVQEISDIVAEPTASIANKLCERTREFLPDYIIGVGGGSVMDVAKIASLLAKNDLSVYDLMENSNSAFRQIPLALIPTTAGTGAEATPNAIVTDEVKELKVGIVNNSMLPDVVFLDASFLLSVPKQVIASTGADALAHAIECFTSNKATDFSNMFALEALKLIFANIRKVYDGNCAVSSYEEMLKASFFAGVAIRHSGTTAVHALSYPLGGKFHIAHGVSNALLLVPIMKFNYPEIKEKFALVYDCAIQSNSGLAVEEKAMKVLKEIESIVTYIETPTRLSELGIKMGDIQFLTDAAFNVKRLLVNNVIEMSKADIFDIYKNLL